MDRGGSRSLLNPRRQRVRSEAQARPEPGRSSTDVSREPWMAAARSLLQQEWLNGETILAFSCRMPYWAAPRGSRRSRRSTHSRAWRRRELWSFAPVRAYLRRGRAADEIVRFAAERARRDPAPRAGESSHVARDRLANAVPDLAGERARGRLGGPPARRTRLQRGGRGARRPRPRDLRSLDRTKVQAVIFDMDGVVTNTPSTHAAAWKRVFDALLNVRAARSGEAFKPFDQESDYHSSWTEGLATTACGPSWHRETSRSRMGAPRIRPRRKRSVAWKTERTDCFSKASEPMGYLPIRPRSNCCGASACCASRRR